MGGRCPCSPAGAGRGRVTFWPQSPPAALERWSSLGLDRVYLDGGALISELLAHALVDDLVLAKVPVLLGSGVPLFHPVLVKTQLWLEAVTSWPSGVVSLSCSRVQKGRP